MDERDFARIHLKRTIILCVPVVYTTWRQGILLIWARPSGKVLKGMHTI